MLPFIEVTHLPSSSSFYSAVVQSLGFRYLSSTNIFDPEGGPSITFGEPPSASDLSHPHPASCPVSSPAFQIREVRPTAERPLKLSHLVLSADSPGAVWEFQSFALRANPPADHRLALLAADVFSFDAPSGNDRHDEVAACTGQSRAKITDFDGNIMEVVYVPPVGYPSDHVGSTVRQTNSSMKQVSRIMRWNYDIAGSEASSPVGSGAERRHGDSVVSRRSRYSTPIGDEPPLVLRRSVTTSTILEPHQPSASPREGSKGITAADVVGILGAAAVGAAAGAALTYYSVTSDRSRAPRQEFDAPAFQRRSTFPEQPYTRGRFLEVERTVEKIRYPEGFSDLAGGHNPPPTYLARYSQVGAPGPRSRAFEDLGDDTRSRHSSRSRYRGDPAPSIRTRSEAPLGRQPLLLTEAEHRSHAGSRHSGAVPSVAAAAAAAASAPPPLSMHHSAYDSADRESYVSARSHHSAHSAHSTHSSSTIRPPPVVAPAVSYPPISGSARSRAGSRVSTATLRAPPPPPPPAPPLSHHSRHSQSQGHQSHYSHHSRPPVTRAASYVSARNVPLPHSTVGSHAVWDEDDGADSIAPSDSISCVGSSSRRSHRSYH